MTSKVNDCKGKFEITQSEFADDPDFIEILITFIEGIDGRIQTMLESLNAQNYDQLSKEAHKLKGTSITYGYPAMAAVADELENISGDDQSVFSLALILNRVRVEHEKIVQGCEQLRYLCPLDNKE